MLNMRELRYENLGTNTYLVYEIGEQDAVDSMSLGMLTNNKIQGLAQTLFSQMDNRKFIKFNVSAKVTVSKFFAGAVNKKRLLGVFNGIVNAMLAAEDYMIEPSSILLDPDYIFADVSTCETDLICLPISDTETQNVDLGPFFRNIMFSTQFDQTENCDHVAKIINYLNGTPTFSLVEFKKLLGEIAGQPAQPVQPVQPAAPQPAVAPQPKAAPVVQSEPAPAPQPQPQSRPSTPVTPAQTLQRPAQPPQTNKRNIPPAANQGKKASAPQVQTKSDEPEISFFYLMQHYNKENAEKYKAQKAAKKAMKGTKQPKPKKTSHTAPAAEQPGINPGYAVPGMAAPAQNTPAPQQPQPQVGPAAVPQQTPLYQMAPAPAAAQPAKPVNFGETTVLSGGPIGETTVLSGAQANQARPLTGFLIRVKTSERIPLNKPVFRIGKERSYVDYFIGDNTAISRSHADIITRDGQFFVVDTNSTNHTYVNGDMLQSNDEKLLANGDKLRLANEEFEFRLE